MLSDFVGYARERVLIPKIGVLWGLLSAAMWFVADEQLLHVASALVIAGLGLVAFRLMDDLADRAHDSAIHPERRLVQTRHVSGFRVIAACLVAVLCVLTAYWLGPVRGLAMLALAVALLALGMAYGMGVKHRAFIAAAVLLKYPALILLMAKEPAQVSTLVLATVLYAIPFAEEQLA
jgi:hypothetical protein